MEGTNMVGDGILTDLSYALRQCRRGEAERAYDALQRIEDAMPELRRLALIGAQVEAGGRVALFDRAGACLEVVAKCCEDAIEDAHAKGLKPVAARVLGDTVALEDYFPGVCG